jgi:hypothetical protein
VEVIDGAVHGSVLAHHVPDDWEVSAEDATEGFEDGVCAEGNVVPCEVWTASAEDNGETYRGYDAGPIFVVSFEWLHFAPGSTTYARPMQKMKLSISFFFVWSCRCHIIGTGIKKIQMSVMRFEMLVKYVKVTMVRQSPFTLMSQ